MLLAEPNGVDRYSLPPDCRDRRQVNSAGIIRAVAHQHDCAQGQR